MKNRNIKRSIVLIVRAVFDRVRFMVLAPSLAADFFSGIKLFIFPVWQIVKKYLIRDSHADFRVRIKEFGNVCTLHVTDHSDLAVFREVFIDKEYNITPGDETPTTIIDIGSNVGFSVIRFSLQFPNARIIACEPDPYAFQKLKLNLSSLKNVKVLNLAITSEDGTISFFSDKKTSMSSSVVPRDTNQDKMIVQSKTLDTLMAGEGIKSIDLLKFDIEGSEYEAFRDFRGIDHVKMIIGEVHPDLMPVPSETFLSIFKKFSIEQVQLSGGRFILFAREPLPNI